MSTTNNICGIDFGTSNSTIGILKHNKPELIKLEGNSPTIPSAVFYEDEHINPELNEVVYGRQALKYYRNHYSGRLLRSFKSVLGTSLMEDTTKVQKVKVPFTKIIQDFLQHMKTQAELIEQQELNYAIIGRPIHFVDGDEEKNRLAQNTLEQIAKDIGFKQVAFQYEPIAASLKYEQSLTNEELVLVIDIGGGTTDISVINLSPLFTNIQDRSIHCLANHGVHIGGTDFDKHLSLHSIMPLLGSLDNMPKHIYHDLATWHRINNVYTPEFRKAIIQARSKLKPIHYTRLMNVLNERLASSIAFNVEESKIELSDNNHVVKDLSFIDNQLSTTITQDDLQHSIHNDLIRIGNTIDECLNQANVSKHDINSIFLTGGSSQMKLIKLYIQSLFPTTKIDNRDSLSSVGTGLVLDATKRFL